LAAIWSKRNNQQGNGFRDKLRSVGRHVYKGTKVVTRGIKHGAIATREGLRAYGNWGKRMFRNNPLTTASLVTGLPLATTGIASTLGQVGALSVADMGLKSIYKECLFIPLNKPLIHPLCVFFFFYFLVGAC